MYSPTLSARCYRQSCTRFYLSSFPFWAYIYSSPSWNSGELFAMLGGYPRPLRNNERTESSFSSLSGPRVLVTPMSPLAQLLRLALPPFRYVIPQASWIIKNGNRGRAIQPM